MMLRRILPAAAALLLVSGALDAQDARGKGGIDSITPAPLREWLSYIASDDLQGREVYTEGLGLAASYIADHLREWGVKPGGPDGTYFQTVKILSVRNESRSSVTVNVKGQRRTFKDGEGVFLARNMGGPQTVRSGEVWFAGYGLRIPSAGVDDYGGIDPKGKVIVWLGGSAPRAIAKDVPARVLAARSRLAVESGAAAVVAPPFGATRGGRGRGAAPGPAPSASPSAAPEAAGPAHGSGRGGQGRVDFVTAQRYDLPVPPVVTAEDAFFEFLFSGSDVPYAELKAKAARQEPLPQFSLDGVTISIDIEPVYAVVATRLSRNVVGIVEGTDPQLKNTFVAFGAHYDHIGYQESAPASAAAVQNPGGCTGQVRREPRRGDIVNNGADDDGSGTVALMAIARAFAAGPRPKRSLVFVWHTAEEAGLQGSRYNADHPVVPNERVIAHLNVDMIGRNRCDDPEEADTVYLVGSDRISTDLHNVSEEANAASSSPMRLDYEMNDPADPQSIYTRSDHYSYAAKGIPVIFYTTGLHRDYHFLTDEVERIEFDKLARVTRLIYATGQRLADREQAPVRDNRGPRVGKGKGGRLE